MNFGGAFDRLFEILPQLAYIIPVILISLTVHEFAHGWVAYKQGDHTAKSYGRLTLNPLAHLDPVGTLMIIFTALTGTGIGWAKPVPFNPSYFRDWKKGTRYVGLAGPVSNFLMAIASGIIFKILGAILAADIVTGVGLSVIEILFTFFFYMIMINISLGVFNLLPVPPLDGSKIFGTLLPDRVYGWMLQNETYIGYAFLAIVIFAPRVLSTVLNPLIDGAWQGISFILTPVEWIMNLFL